MTDQKTIIEDIFKNKAYGPAPESDVPAKSWIDAHNGKFGMYIDGAFTKPKTGKNLFDVIAPASGEDLAKVSQASKADIDKAVAAARKAQPEWAALSGAQRGQYLYTLARALYDQARTFEVIESLDNGKPFRETHNADIPLAIKHFDHHQDYAILMDNDPAFAGQDPYGVVGQIIPWNFPLLMLAWKVAPALAAGNTVVLKPAEQTPLTALKFAEMCKEIGLPDGVLNIVTGDGRVGAMITEHDGIDKVAFTGSTDVGRHIRKATAGTGKGLTLELGGKSPFIVFDDADIDTAIEGVVNAIWFNQGEVCCGGSRLLVQESIYPRFIDKLKKRMQKLRVGGPLDKAIDVGSVIDKSQHGRINGFVERAAKEGAEVFQACETEGAFYPPTLITGINTANEIMQEEVFGPVISAMSFRTPSEAVELANNTRFGLAASVWTENLEKANAVAAQVKAGIIWINNTNQFDATVGFGGYRESGYGREGGHEGMYAYLKPQSEKPIGEVDISKATADHEFETSALTASVDQTRKFFIGGKEARPDGGQTRNVINDKAELIGRVGVGSRKDIRNAVEAARKAEGSWAGKTPYQRAQVLKFIGERFSEREQEFAQKLQISTGQNIDEALQEVRDTISVFFNYAAWASKYEGRVHRASSSNALIPSLNEYIGVVGVAAPNEKPLLSFATMTAAALAGGNSVVAVPSEKYPLPAMDLTEIFRTSDVPPGAVNIITGDRDELAETMAQHHNVDALWYHGSKDGSAMVETEAANSNLKQTWTNVGKAVDWKIIATTGSPTMMRRATQVKNISVPFGMGLA